MIGFIYIIAIAILVLFGLAGIWQSKDWIMECKEEIPEWVKDRSEQEKPKLKNRIIILLVIWLAYCGGLTAVSVCFALENKKVDYDMVYKEYTTELYAFTDSTQESTQGSSSYFLFIGGENINTTSEYKVTYLVKTENGLYQRKSLFVNEKYDEIKIYYDIQEGDNITPKLITKTESHSESYMDFWCFGYLPEEIISYTFVIPKDSIQYDNIINS